MQENKVSGSLVELAHSVVADAVGPGDAVVDATLGNGHDTLFLARCVGDTGKVYGFDIQQDAISATHERLTEAGIAEPAFTLHQTGHEDMASRVPKGVASIMFNLGYLPGGDKRKITLLDTSLAALESALDLLAPGGVLTVMCYPGHEGGGGEAKAVRALLMSRDGVGIDLVLYRREGARASAPFLLVAKKRPAPGGELAAQDC